MEDYGPQSGHSGYLKSTPVPTFLSGKELRRISSTYKWHAMPLFVDVVEICNFHLRFLTLVGRPGDEATRQSVGLFHHPLCSVITITIYNYVES